MGRLIDAAKEQQCERCGEMISARRTKCPRCEVYDAAMKALWSGSLELELNALAETDANRQDVQELSSLIAACRAAEEVERG